MWYSVIILIIVWTQEAGTDMMNRMKKRAAAFCTAVLVTVFAAAFTLTAYAAEKPEIAAQGAALYNATTGEFLFGKNENHQYR